jgi:hypothetical protein
VETLKNGWINQEKSAGLMWKATVSTQLHLQISIRICFSGIDVVNTILYHRPSIFIDVRKTEQIVMYFEPTKVGADF